MNKYKYSRKEIEELMDEFYFENQYQYFGESGQKDFSKLRDCLLAKKEPKESKCEHKELNALLINKELVKYECSKCHKELDKIDGLKFTKVIVDEWLPKEELEVEELKGKVVEDVKVTGKLNQLIKARNALVKIIKK